MSEPTKIRATVKGSEGEVRVLMPHPMESGQRRDPKGQILPANYITSVTLSLNGRPVIEGAGRHAAGDRRRRWPGLRRRAAS